MEHNKKTAEAELVVIGGGPAGMMCAATAAERGMRVILLEPNRLLGRKLRITGKGRCNVTNNCDIKTFMENIPGDGRFLYSALNRLSPTQTMELFESHGLKLKTERGNRVFPVSDNANDVAGTMAHWCERAGVRVMHTHAKGVRIENGIVTGVPTDEGMIDCRAAAICTGGLTYALTGSTGDGYKFARSAGHTIDTPWPSLVPLESDDDYCAEMQGFALKNVTLSAYENDVLIYRELGEMLFTHFGVSGPLVLSASAHLRNWEKETYRLSIDLKPALDEQKLEGRILRDLGEAPNRSVERIFSGLVPHSMVPVILNRLGMDPQQQANAVTREQRRALVQLLKRFTMPVTGPRPVAEAIITSGGVKVGQVQPATMASKLVQGLYFAGEILDVDAYTGGFNLQIAWATGHCAGVSAAEE